MNHRSSSKVLRKCFNLLHDRYIFFSIYTQVELFMQITNIWKERKQTKGSSVVNTNSAVQSLCSFCLILKGNNLIYVYGTLHPPCYGIFHHGTVRKTIAVQKRALRSHWCYQQHATHYSTLTRKSFLRLSGSTSLYIMTTF